jgi:hypothetical protein
LRAEPTAAVAVVPGLPPGTLDQILEEQVHATGSA